MKAFLSKGQAATEMHKPTRTPGIERELHQKRQPNHLVMTNIAMERSTHAIKNGMAHLFLWAIYTMAMLNRQRVNGPFSIAMLVYWRVLLRIS